MGVIVPSASGGAALGSAQVGLASARPAANTVPAGYLYYATDTNTLSESNGATWTTVVSGGGSGALAVISQQVLASPAATVTFSSIPGTYENLILQIEGAFTGGAADVELQFNGDTAANYDWQLLNGNNTTATASAGAAQTAMVLGQLNQAGTPAAQACSIRIVIPGYATTNFNKTVMADNMRITGTTAVGFVRTASGGNWRSAAAITSVVVLNDGATTYVANSRFTLYGETG